MNLFPGKIKQLPSAGRAKYFIRNWQKLKNDPMILNVVTGFEIPFILLPMKSKLPNMCHLTKEAADLVDQEVQDILRKGTIEVLDPKTTNFSVCCFL